MFEYIKGTLTASSPSQVTIEAHGIGYLLFIPLNNYAQLPPMGTLLTLYTFIVIREDSHKSYGFLTRDQRDLFERLIDISGIGPKTALTLLGHLEINDLQIALSQSDISLLSKIPGIGKKTAERLIVEMRDKMKKLDHKPSFGTHKEQGTIGDAISALVNLGYNPTQAHKAIKTALSLSSTEPQLAELITTALRSL